MTDGKVEFVSDFFSTTSTDLTAAYSVVMTGSQIRLGNLYEKKVYISYEDFYNDINSLFNIAFSIELINGVPFEEGDQDRLQEDVLDITEQELKYWEKRGIDPNYIYDLASEGWEEHIN